MTSRARERPASSVPLLFRVSRALERRGLRGGTAAERLCRRLGLLDRPVRQELSRGISVDVPIAARPMDGVDLDAYEQKLVALLAAALDAMDGPVVLLDCGADFGLVSLKLVARCARIERVVAFEPNASMHPVLAANLARLPIGAEARLAAVGEACGRGALRYPAHDPTADVSRFVALEEKGDVSITTIDALAIEPGGCVALKCDVEGSELAVVRGARRTLARSRQFVVAFEAHPLHVARTGIDPVTIVRELCSIRPCAVTIAETGAVMEDDVTPLFQQVGSPRIVNLVCESARME